MLIDVVSKNGNLLFSIPVRGNGSIDEKERKVLADAYHLFEKDGVNKGGAFSGVIEENLTTQYLVEAQNFTRSAGGNSRFGKPANWTVENFNIPNGGDGTKQGRQPLQPHYLGASSATTGITENRQETISNHHNIYDLQGRRLVRPSKGFNIVDGRKVVVK